MRKVDTTHGDVVVELKMYSLGRLSLCIPSCLRHTPLWTLRTKHAFRGARDIAILSHVGCHVKANSTTTTMLFSALLCSSIALSSASPLGALLENQVSFELRNPDSSFQIPNGFNIDLESMRLVQFNDGEEPVWISELDKVCLRAT